MRAKIFKITVFSLFLFCTSLLNAGTLDEALVKKQIQTVTNTKEMAALRCAALKILVKEKAKAVIPVIKEIALDTSADQKLRIMAIQSIPEYYPEIADDFIDMADKFFLLNLLPFEGDRAGARWRKFNPKELPYIIEFMYALAKTGKSEAIPFFILPIRVKETHHLTPLVMGEMGKPAVAFLLSMLEDEDPKTRKNAAISLGKIGDKRAVLALVEMLKEDSNVTVRLEVAKNLVLLGDKKAIPFLEESKKNAKLDQEAKELEKAIKALREKK